MRTKQILSLYNVGMETKAIYWANTYGSFGEVKTVRVISETPKRYTVDQKDANGRTFFNKNCGEVFECAEDAVVAARKVVGARLTSIKGEKSRLEGSLANINAWALAKGVPA